MMSGRRADCADGEHIDQRSVSSTEFCARYQCSLPAQLVSKTTSSLNEIARREDCCRAAGGASQGLSSLAMARAGTRKGGES